MRADTRLEVEASVQGSLLQVWGRLLDDRQQPLARRTVLVHVQHDGDAALERHEVVTREDGGFNAILALADGAAQLRVLHESDALYEGVQATLPLATNRSLVQLALSVPDPVRLDAPSARLDIDARSLARAAHLPLHIEDESGREIAQGRTDEDGLLSVDLETSRLGPPGAGKLTVRFVGDELRAPARAERAILRQYDTQLSLDAQLSDGTLVVRGLLQDARGPLADKAVGVFVNGTHVLTRMTSVDGSYEGATPVFDLDDSDAVVVARFESDMPGIAGSVSDATTLPRSGPGATRLIWLVLPLLMAALIVVGARRREARRSPSPPRRRPLDQVLAWGARPGRRSALRTISGEVVDATLEAPIPDATIELHDASGVPHAIVRTARGSFQAEGLDDGDYELRAWSDRHAVRRARFTIPHAGDGTGMRIGLVDLRRAALDAHQPVAERVFTDRRAASAATVREAFAHAHQTGRATALLADLTSRVERAAYAPEAPSQFDVHAVEELAEGSLAELDRPVDRKE